MNVFLMDESFTESAAILSKHDPVRARKQLVECCQLLASAEHALTGSTIMRKKDGSLYKVAHPNHPITLRIQESYSMYLTTVALGLSLAKHFTAHACSASMIEWHSLSRLATIVPMSRSLVVCRKGKPNVTVWSLRDYAKMMKAYIIEYKWKGAPPYG